MFTGHNRRIDERILQYLPTLVTPEQNQKLQEMPTLEELKQMVFAMNPNSAPGPDGIGGKFYQACWNIIKEDLLAAVQHFFCGHIMPKFMSHVCLVLLPKKEQPNNFSDLRPISLSNFSNKIISKLLSMRLADIIPLLISDNQFGFVRGRSITESIMLAQEITHDIKRPKEGDNVVIKLDMTKAYDRVSWSFTCLVLRRLGFGEFFIDLVWRTMSNNWYSIIINSHRHGFFHSTRGLKQGDPLSPALFILGAEVLSRMLNNILQNPIYRGFNMEPKGPQINHLSFADDVIIFTSSDTDSLRLIMATLEEYEHTSDQLINKEKSHFMVPSNTPQDITNNIQQVTGFTQKDSPITYLGCPLYIGRQRIIYYSQLVEKVSKKICGWQARILSFGGKITLVKHALQSIPIHTMAAISPPSTTIKYIESIIADFFWGRDQDHRKYHWASLETMSLPYDEGGVGLKRLTDICTSLQYKQWWNFRAKDSLWGQFLRSKYCQRANPVAQKVDTGQSLVWRYMTKNKDKVENHITWKIRSGSCSFWWDDWLGMGALAKYTSSISILNNATIAHFLVNGEWNERKLRQQVPPLLIPHILSTKFQYQQGDKDTAVWKPNDSGNFSCASAWKICRLRKSNAVSNSQIWHKNIPFKMSFLVWRALRYKLPTNEKLATFGVEPVRCYCCIQRGWDEVDHIFNQGSFATHIWTSFLSPMGVTFQRSSLSNHISRWNDIQGKNEAHKTLIETLPIVVCWNLWKNRCSAKYGGKKSSSSSVKYMILKDILHLLNTVFPYICWPAQWTEVVDLIASCKHDVKVTCVTWKTPPPSSYKLNTDGSALHNPGKIGGGGILRDEQGKIIYAFALPLGEGTNNQAEIQAASYGLNWCIQHGYNKIILEVDSELLTKWILQTATPPWRIQKFVQELQKLASQCETFQCNHIYREANSTADTLSKQSHKKDITQHYYTYNQLPYAARGSYILEKMGVQSFRRKKLKRIKKPP
ncbi:hypothetical protein MTR67_039018 [Solanum verrucosum]|uniref:Reverse transcriptase domain-containing protein n=1 Tax=Solanum verrucosum TaxID=315347 RepID=A0AAF0ZQ10_SOLVR|nr:hypothetical protein MTR67_039018 [Solanum verrucosum]